MPCSEGSATGTQIRVGVLQGDGKYGLKVAGTSLRQIDLQNLADGRTDQDAHYMCAALLVPEPDNPYDPNALAVYVIAGGQKIGVGYVQRDIAPPLNRGLRRNIFSAAVCDAVIVGDSRDDSRSDGYFSMHLDACLPFLLRPLEHNAPIASRPIQIGAAPVNAPRRPRYVVGMFVVLAFIIAAVCAVYFWVNIGR